MRDLTRRGRRLLLHGGFSPPFVSARVGSLTFGESERTPQLQLLATGARIGPPRPGSVRACEDTGEQIQSDRGGARARGATGPWLNLIVVAFGGLRVREGEAKPGTGSSSPSRLLGLGDEADGCTELAVAGWWAPGRRVGGPRAADDAFRAPRERRPTAGVVAFLSPRTGRWGTCAAAQVR